jgi:hypothetical protein
LGSNFYKKLVEVASSVGMRPEDILNVMAMESSLDPSARNPAGGAVGLIQIMPKYLSGLGFHGTPQDFAKSPPEEQLKYVEKLIKENMKLNGGRPFGDATQYYVSNWLPAALKIPGVQQRNSNTIIASKNPTEPHIPNVSIGQEQKYYEANKGLDSDHDGNITYGDLARKLANARQSGAYQKALANLQTHTEYKPQAQKNLPDSNVPASKTPNSDTASGGIMSTLQNIMDKFLHLIFAAEKQNKKLYKNMLPMQNIVIEVAAKDYNNSIEFSRILCSALNEELSADTWTHTNGNNVEVQCNIAGPAKECFDTVCEITASVVDAFKLATIKIGGIQIQTTTIMNKKSSYQAINCKTAELNYRKFLLKFV